MAQVRQFTTSPAIIRHLIESQAGTLAKAIAEAVANAIDAGARSVSITLDNEGFSIADDGRGIQSEEEILRCFEQFGFEHDDRERVHGKFGLGRGQAWAFASTVWHTHQFGLDVDIRARGLNYTLHNDLPTFPGLKITGTFYERRSEVQLHADRLELEALVRFTQVPVTINGGEPVSKNPDGQKWDVTTDEAFLRVTDDYRLQVYSQGILVREYSRSHVGVGGVLVTKVGRPLALNMARNDVLTASCPLWKSMLKALLVIADSQAGKASRRMTAHDRDFFAARLWNADGLSMLDKDLFTLTDGRHLTLRSIVQRCHKGAVFTTAAAGDRVAEKAIRTGQGVVLAPATLRRFGVTTPTALLERLRSRAASSGYWEHALHSISAVKDDIARCAFFTEAHHSTLATTDLEPAARTILTALTRAADHTAYILRSAGHEHAARAASSARAVRNQ